MLRRVRGYESLVSSQTRAWGDQHQELRTACLLSTTRRRYVSGVGLALKRQVHAAVHAC